MNTDAATSNAGSRFARLFVSQLGYKVLSFGLTSLLTRAFTPNAKGVGFFFEMYFLSAGFLSREAIRSLHARAPPLDASVSKARSAIRASGLWCAIVALVLLIPMCVVHASMTVDPELRGVLQRDFGVVVVVAVLATALVLELLGETHWNMGVHAGGDGRGIAGRATAESLSLLCRTSVTACVVYASAALRGAGEVVTTSTHLRVAVLAFGLGHLAYGATSFLLSCAAMARLRPTEGNHDAAAAAAAAEGAMLLHVHLVRGGPGLSVVVPSAASLRDAWAFYTVEQRPVMSQLVQENVLRLFLTEGEKFVLSASGVALAAQGAFDVATSLGALVARLLFRLWEEFAFNEWARGAAAIVEARVAASSPSPSTSLPASGGVAAAAAAAATAAGDAAVARMVRANVELLHSMCRVALAVGVVCCAFGPLLAGRVLQLFFGARWANKEAADILAVYSCVLPLFGVNGLVEAFGRAFASAGQMRRTRWQLVAVSVAYFGASYSALRASGGDVKWLIGVNGAQFALRIAIGLVAARNVVSSQSTAASSSWREFLLPFAPSRWLFAYCAAVAACAWRFAPPRFDDGDTAAMRRYASHLTVDAVVAVAALGSVVVAALCEPAAVAMLRSKVSSIRARDKQA